MKSSNVIQSTNFKFNKTYRPTFNKIVYKLDKIVKFDENVNFVEIQLDKFDAICTFDEIVKINEIFKFDKIA